MTKKLFALAAGLGLTMLASIPQAEAVPYCSSTYCKGKPKSTVCGCPPGTDKVGQAATGGMWNKIGVCLYG